MSNETILYPRGTFLSCSVLQMFLVLLMVYSMVPIDEIDFAKYFAV